VEIQTFFETGRISIALFDFQAETIIREVHMSFDLVAWLRGQIGAYELDIPLIDIASKTPDEHREWLITNGLGSFASANIWGANSRRYHGLGIFALEPPVGRTVMWSRIDEVADGESLATSYWTSGAVSPEGYKQVVAFTIYPVPTWVFELPGGHLIKQVAMPPGKQEVVVGYTWLGAQPLKLSLKFLLNYRDFHGETKGWADWRFQQDVQPERVRIKAFTSATELVLAFSRGAYRPEPDWYWGYYWPREHERGLGFREDNFLSGRLEVSLEPGAAVTVRGGLDSTLSAGSIADAVRAVAARQSELIAKAGASVSPNAKRLVVAADQFIVQRRSTQSDSIIAGYHWFGDWGRDSMISLTGLALSTGRYEIAAGILTTFGHYLSDGMLPNNFPDSGQTPHYNTADATFWWAWAIHKYFQATGDLAFVTGQLPLLDSVVVWHQKGTRYKLHVDQSDGLILGGEPGVQLTWMDAKVGDMVVTPRSGKPVEINALWFNFLKILESLHQAVGGDYAVYGALLGAHAEQAKKGFEAFWNPDTGCLFDVIREDGSKDASIRPNQLLAISLPYQLVSNEQAKSILAVVERELLTPYGLRTLSPKDPSYTPRYGGGKDVATQYDRDITYHQGTVWPWLFGPWVDARIKVHGLSDENKQFIASQLAGIKQHMLAADGLGSVSEIFDGDAPHTARGCVAQAWSVAELLRVFSEYQL
jgi:predicted glycogen debranching enzyme